MFFMFFYSWDMYLAITLYILINHLELTDKTEVKKALKEISMEFVYN